MILNLTSNLNLILSPPFYSKMMESNILTFLPPHFNYSTKLLYLLLKKYDPVPGFIVSEQLGFLKFIKKKATPEMECPYCGGKSFPIDLSKFI